jgi:uncharacterized membrane protein
LLVSFALAVVVGAVAAASGMGRASPLVGWDVAALIYCGWIWFTLWPMDATSTAQHALREEPNRNQADLILLGAAIASLAAVGWVLFRAGDASGDLKYLEAGFALVSVFLSWTLVHTVFTLKYARLYYSGDVGGISFNQTEAPQYSDFAYLAFTIGMTFQVSDTNIETKQIIATSINLISGLAK